jgi:2,6-dihydroxypseudooxynicotine hydrolase
MTPPTPYARLEREARTNGINYRALLDHGHFIPRFITAGLHYTDTMETLGRIRDDDAWCAEWCATGREHEERAVDARATGRYLTASMAFYRASLCYHFAQLLHYRDLAAKWAAEAKAIHCYRAGMAWFAPAAEIFDIPFEDVSLPGYLRLPPGRDTSPCVMILSGTDSTKQEYQNLENQLLVRGLATLSFDGPGQGEAWERVKLRPAWETAASAALDALTRRREIDANRVAVLGVSFGGHLAVRAAATDPRFRACVTSGGFFETSYYDWSQPLRHIRFRYICGTEDIEVAKRVARTFDLAGIIERLRAPLLVVHGRHDEVTPPEQAERIYKEARGPKQLAMFEDGNHVCHNIPYKAHPLIADWLAETLGARP